MVVEVVVVVVVAAAASDTPLINLGKSGFIYGLSKDVKRSSLCSVGSLQSNCFSQVLVYPILCEIIRTGVITCDDTRYLDTRRLSSVSGLSKRVIKQYHNWPHFCICVNHTQDFQRYVEPQLQEMKHMRAEMFSDVSADWYGSADYG